MNKLYFITDNENIKIGFSKHPEKRKEELQTGNSSYLKIIYIIDNVPRSFEKHVHGICKNYRIKGEWFKKEAINHLLNHPWFKEHMLKSK